MPMSALLVFGVLTTLYVAYRALNPVCAAAVSWIFRLADTHPRHRTSIVIVAMISWIGQILATPFVVEHMAATIPSAHSGLLIAGAAVLLVLQTGLVAVHVVKHTTLRPELAERP